MKIATRSIALALFIASLNAQPTVAPTPESAGPPTGENHDGYNVRQSFELGVRFKSAGGNQDEYRSMINFGNGLSLLSSSLSIQSLDGHGHLFDLIQLNTQGLGSDPYQSARLRIEKNKFYRYDLSWRSSSYFNSGTFYDPNLNYTSGQHLLNTARDIQDHDFTLFPQGNFKLFLGFSRNTQTGPALTTLQQFDARGDEYPLFANVHRRQNEFRLGFESTFKGWKLNAMHGWVNYNEDTPVQLTSPSQGNNPDDATTLSSFSSTGPYHGSSPYSRVMLFREAKKWSFNGRFTYVDGQRGFVQDTSALGTDRLGAPISQQTITMGDARRPAATGNATVSYFPWSKLTLTNQTSVYNIRMDGSSVFAQFTNGAPIAPFVPFTYLGILTIANSTDADLRLTKWLAVRATYEYSTRRIRSIEGQNFTTPQTPIEQQNGLHSAILGLRIKPTKSLTLNIDGEIGRADHPIYPISDRNYQAFRARTEYRHKAFRLAAYARSDYNVNSASPASYASHTRQYGIDGTWTLARGFFIDVSYVKMHLDTLGALDYFARVGTATTDITTMPSRYISNLHNSSLSLRIAPGNKWDLSIGFSQVRDAGDGRSAPVPALICTTQCAAITPFYAVQTFPLYFTSPQARLSFQVSKRVRWNIGYQHYGYTEDFATAHNYRAHTGYTSALWSF